MYACQAVNVCVGDSSAARSVGSAERSIAVTVPFMLPAAICSLRHIPRRRNGFFTEARRISKSGTRDAGRRRQTIVGDLLGLSRRNNMARGWRGAAYEG